MRRIAGGSRRWLAAVLAAGVAVPVLVMAPQAAQAASALSLGPTWSTQSSATSRVRAFARLGSTVFIGGEFTKVTPTPGGTVVDQTLLFAVDTTTGAMLPDFRPRFSGPRGTTHDPLGVLALEVDPATNTLFVGGSFDTVNGEAVAGLAVLDASSGALKEGYQRPASRNGGRVIVHALERRGAELYVGGEFDQLGGQPRHDLARLNVGAPGFPVDGWTATVNDGVLGLATDPVYPDRVYVSGRFSAAGPQLDRRANNLAAFLTTARDSLLPWFPRPQSSPKPPDVLSVDAAGGRVFAGVAGGGGQLNIYDGTIGASRILLKHLQSDGNIQAVRVIGDRVYAGGHHDAFTSPTISYGKLIALRLDTLDPDPTFDVRVRGVWGTFAILDGDPNDVWLGGQLTNASAGGTSQSAGNVVHLTASPRRDQTPPSTPAVAAAADVFGTARVRWTPSTDDTSVMAYTVFVDGRETTAVSGAATSLLLGPYAAGTSHTVALRAVDGSRRTSATSAAASFVAGAAAPSLPGTLKAFGEYQAVDPSRILDTRTGIGTGSTQPVVAGQRQVLRATGVGGVPVAGVAAVVLNVTITGPTVPGFLSVVPGGQPGGSVSSLNFAAGQTLANLVTVKVAADGTADIHLSGGTAHVIADVVGWYANAAAPSPASRMEATTPARLLDTRATRALGPGQTVDIAVAPPGSSTSAVVVNLTATDATTSTYLTAYPGDRPSPPLASNLNLLPGQTRPNLAIVRVPESGVIRVFNFAGNTHVIVDLVARFTRTTSFDNDPEGRLVPLDAPMRLVDTRARGTKLGPRSAEEIDLAAIAQGFKRPVLGLVVNVTATQATATTFLTLFPAHQEVPLASTLNVVAGVDVANAAVAKLASDGKAAVYNDAGTVHYLVDLVGVILGG